MTTDKKTYGQGDIIKIFGYAHSNNSVANKTGVTIVINKTHSEAVMGYTKLDQHETTDRPSIITDKNGYHNYSTISTDEVRYKTIAIPRIFQDMPIKENPQIKKHCSYFIFGKKYFSYYACYHALFRNCFFYWINNCDILWPKNRFISARQ